LIIYLFYFFFFFKKANGEGDEPQKFLHERRNGEKKKKCNTLWRFVCAGTSMIALRRKSRRSKGVNALPRISKEAASL
jgi:hypothetical protein